MTNPYRAMCAEALALFDGYDNGERVDWDAWRTSARILLAQTVAEGPTDEALLDIARAADLVYYMGKGRGFASPYVEGADISGEVLAFARTLLAQPEPQSSADGEVAVSLIELRSTVMGLGQMGMHVAAKRVERAADLLERFASPARLVINSSPEATND